jgi:putative hydrolase of the HAD superfamily
MNNSVVVFDLDDTIVKEIDYLSSAFWGIIKKCLNSESVIIHEKMMHWYFSGYNVFENVIAEYCPNFDIEKMKSVYRSHKPNIELDISTKNLFLDLKERNIKLGLITDGYSETQRNKIQALGLESFFDLVVISEEFGYSKPSREPFVAFMKKFPNHKYFYIGDNQLKDFVAPNKLGWDTVMLVDNGRNIKRESIMVNETYKAKKVINCLSMLNSILNNNKC